jgi:lysophospholipase L1-like esterase
VRETIARLGLVCGGVLLGLALLEGGLRLAAVVAPSVFTRAAAPADDARLRIACVGDSHVYGAFVPPRDAFPEQLDRILHRRGLPVDVYNFGIPGQNSFQVRQRLPRILARVRPQVVVVLVGHNNYWNLSERRIAAPESTPAWSWRDLRLARLLHVLRVSLSEGAAAARRPELRMVAETPKGEQLLLDLGDGMEQVDMWWGDQELPPDEIERITDEDLVAIVEEIRGVGAVPVLLRYPVAVRPQREAVQRAIERAARQTGVLCLDATALTSRLQARRRLDRLFFADLHPTARYYRVMAWTLGRQFARRGLIAGSAPDRPATEGGCAPLI